VTLYEKNEKTGGAILLASRVDEGAAELMRPIQYLEGACRKAGFELITGFDVTPAHVADWDADIVVIATGANASPLPVGHGLPVYTPEDIVGKGIKPPAAY